MHHGAQRAAAAFVCGAPRAVGARAEACRRATREFPSDKSAWHTAAHVLEEMAERLAAREKLSRAECIAYAAAGAYRELARVDVDTKHPGLSLRLATKCEQLANDCAHARKHPTSGSRIRV
jgi:hypothetical protein